MADFRFAGRWLNDRRVMSLTGDDFKAFVTAGTYMVENRTDGRITADDLDFIPRFSRPSIPKLVAAGLWATDSDGWLMIDYQGTQTSRAEFEVLENARRREREKKERQRAIKSESVPGDIPGDTSRGTTQARQGKARQGQDQGEAWHEGEVDQATGELLDPPPVSWPTAVPPADPGYCEHGMTTGKRCRHCPGAVAEARAA